MASKYYTCLWYDEIPAILGHVHVGLMLVNDVDLTSSGSYFLEITAPIVPLTFIIIMLIDRYGGI